MPVLVRNQYPVLIVESNNLYPVCRLLHVVGIQNDAGCRLTTIGPQSDPTITYYVARAERLPWFQCHMGCFSKVIAIIWENDLNTKLHLDG
jgi:hypothetical protein